LDRRQEVCGGMGKCVVVLDGQQEVGKWVWCGQWCGEVGDGVTKWAVAWENGWWHGEVGGGNTRGSSVEGWQHHSGGVAKWAAAWQNRRHCGKGGSGGVTRGGSVEGQCHHVPVGGVSTKKKNLKKGGTCARVLRQAGAVLRDGQAVFWIGGGIAI
jgi:hypothetical protein